MLAAQNHTKNEVRPKKNGTGNPRHPQRTKQISLIPHSGVDYVRDTIRYCGISTPVKDRQEIGIRGLVPAACIPLELDVERCIEQMRSKETDLEKYIYLHSILDVSERLYYGILAKHTAECMPIVYTPT